MANSADTWPNGLQHQKASIMATQETRVSKVYGKVGIAQVNIRLYFGLSRNVSTMPDKAHFERKLLQEESAAARAQRELIREDMEGTIKIFGVEPNWSSQAKAPNTRVAITVRLSAQTSEFGGTQDP